MLVRTLARAGRHGEARRSFDRWVAAMRAIDAPVPDPDRPAARPGAITEPRAPADPSAIRGSDWSRGRRSDATLMPRCHSHFAARSGRAATPAVKDNQGEISMSHRLTRQLRRRDRSGPARPRRAGNRRHHWRGRRPPSDDCGGTGNVINGTSGNDTIDGTSGNDVIDGRGGNDTIDGKGGNDVILGSGGEDVIRGGTATTASTVERATTVRGGAATTRSRAERATTSSVAARARTASTAETTSTTGSAQIPERPERQPARGRSTDHWIADRGVRHARWRRRAGAPTRAAAGPVR